MNFLWIALVWVLNFGISIWNAYTVGKAWAETKHHGGWPRFMAWMGAIMSASGFSWCYLIILAFTAHHFEWITQQQMEAALNLGYVLLIPGVLFSGLMITLDSWAQAYRTRRIGDFGIAAYNTFAQIHNSYRALNDFGSAFRSVFDFFGSDSGDGDSDSDNKGGIAILVVIVLVAVALLAGVLTTAYIIKRVAGTQPLPPWEEVEKRRLSQREVRQPQG
jgi:hypothetical protein